MTRNIFGGLHRAHNRVMTVMLLTPTSTTRWHSTTCPHVSHLTPTPTNILLPPSTSHPPLSTSTPLLCHTCLTPVAPKLCMTCQTMFCGRTAGSHALHHYQDKVHEREERGRGDKGREKREEARGLRWGERRRRGW